MDDALARKLTKEWVEAWNAHDLDAIMEHYADDIELVSPVAIERLGDPSGAVKGKKALREYFALGLKAYPDLFFDLYEVMVGVRSFAAYYKSIKGRLSAEVFFLNDAGKISRVYAHYGRVAEDR